MYLNIFSFLSAPPSVEFICLFYICIIMLFLPGCVPNELLFPSDDVLLAYSRSGLIFLAQPTIS